MQKNHQPDKKCDNWLDFVSLGYSAFIGPYASKCDLTNSRGDLTLVPF